MCLCFCRVLALIILQVREQDYPLVEVDFANMALGRNMNGYAQSGFVLFGAVFIAVGSLPSVSWPLLSFPFVFVWLLLIRSMLTFRR